VACSISGFLRLRGQASIDFTYSVKALLAAAEERGRDSCGIVTVSDSAHMSVIKRTMPAGKMVDAIAMVTWATLVDPAGVMINTNRAQPSTEQWDRTSLDFHVDQEVPPFTGVYWAVAHNGTIANDRELAEKYGVTKPAAVDSSVLVAILDKIMPQRIDEERLAQFLRDEVVGSFALALVHLNSPGQLILARNYKPLFYAVDATSHNRLLWFSSMPQYLQKALPNLTNAPVEVEPYTMTVFTRHDGTVRARNHSLWPRASGRKALVIASAGLDSAVTACELQRQGFEVELLHFKYGSRAQDSEWDYIQRFSKALHMPLRVLDISQVYQQIGHSRLTNTWEGPINTDRQGEAAAELAHEWVPARNLVLLSLATAIADAENFDYIAVGTNLEESGSYPDNEQLMMLHLNRVLANAVNAGHRVRILEPVGHMMKPELVVLGSQNHTPFELTWSCYQSGPTHCGVCGSCFLRKQAFKQAGVTDPTAYAE
jgi:7-cyano-7-deazaguanine synthase